MIKTYVASNWNSWKVTITKGIRIFFYTSGGLAIDFVISYIRGEHSVHKELWAIVGPGLAMTVRVAEGWWRNHGYLPDKKDVTTVTSAEVITNKE